MRNEPTHCPKCMRVLKYKTNKRNNNKFLGCTGYPKCDFIYHPPSDYLCNRVRTDWYYDYRHLEKVLNRCQSKVEISYFLGALYYLESNRGKNENLVNVNTQVVEIEYLAETYSGAQIVDVFCFWDCNSPTTLAFVPQVKFGDKCHHDFGVFYSSERYPKASDWRFGIAVEVDQYPTHNFYPEKDVARDILVSYPVVRVRDSTYPYSKWFELVIRLWQENGTFLSN